MAKLKTRKFKCPKCERTFSMAAHLARHLNTTHAAKGKRKVAKKKAGRRALKKMVRRASPVKQARRAALGDTPLLQQMQAYRSKLITERAGVSAQIDAIDQALAALGATPHKPAGRPKKRAGRPSGVRRGSLKHYVERVLHTRGRQMAVKDVTTAVQKAGFKSKNRTLAKSVGIALSQMPNVARVARGVFRLR